MPSRTVHTSSLFDPKEKKVIRDISITVDPSSGLITRIFKRDDTQRPFAEIFRDGDIDLRGKFVMPGLVDAHTHVFLHSYE
jgi:imidazolonepropionase-like amidohydrolase